MSRCSNCGSEQIRSVRREYRFAESGLDYVLLSDVELIHCDACGNEDPVLPSMAELMKTIALAVISKPFPLQGQDVRFVRKYLNMTGDQFARLIKVDKTTLSKWENAADPVGPQSDRLIRVVGLALGEGLLELAPEVIREKFGLIENSTGPNRLEVKPGVHDAHHEDLFEYEYA